MKSVFSQFKPVSRRSGQKGEGANGSIKQALNISAVAQSLYMSSRLLFFILLYELSIVPREQIEIFKQIITGFFLKPQHHFHSHTHTHTLDSFALFPSKRRVGAALTLLYYKWSGLLVFITGCLFLIPFTIFDHRRRRPGSGWCSYPWFSWLRIKGAIG